MNFLLANSFFSSTWFLVVVLVVAVGLLLFTSFTRRKKEEQKQKEQKIIEAEIENKEDKKLYDEGTHSDDFFNDFCFPYYDDKNGKEKRT